MEASYATPQREFGGGNSPQSLTPLRRILRVLPRIALIIVVTWAFGWVLNRSASSANARLEPAGFGRGMIHGALMPGAMPSLLLGRDVVIYASNNNGRLYKLGYTCGVNAAGAFFFGSFYFRVSRWRRTLGLKAPGAGRLSGA
jgi:hypothetical protein